MSRSALSSRDHVAIAIGGVAGATCRWLLGTAVTGTPDDGGWFAYAPSTSVAVPPPAAVPALWGTIAANLIGCLLLGAIATLLVRSSVSKRRLLLAAGTGFCGALTTFATFAVEAVVLLRDAPAPPGLHTLTPPTPHGLTYIAISLIGGAVAFWLGRSAARTVGAP